MPIKISRIRLAYSGWVGGPGLTTFYHAPKNLSTEFDQTQINALATRVRTWAVAAQAYYATLTVCTINTQVDILDAVNGELLESYIAADPGAVGAASASAPYAPACAALLQWKTAGIVHGHAVKGRTFISPLAASMVSSGTLVSGATTGLPSISAPLIAGAAGEPRLCVWSRPVTVAKPKVPVRDGSAHLVIGATTPAKVAVLRSRRD